MYSQDTAQQNEQRCSGATIRREDMMNYRSYTTLTCDMGGLLSSLKATLFYFTFNDVDTKRLWHDISCVWLWKRILHCQFHTTVCNFVDNIFAFFQFSFFYYGPFILYVYISDLYSALHTTPSCFLRGKFLRRLVCGWRATVLYIALLLTCSLHPCDACTSPHPKHWFCVICVQCVLLEWVFQWNCLPSSSLQG